jgi:3-hydroxyisobutyrate dehydrogenase
MKKLLSTAAIIAALASAVPASAQRSGPGPNGNPGRARKARDTICRRVSERKWRVRQSGEASGAKVAYDKVKDLIRAFAPRGVFYVGDGELARVCKIAHNVMLGVVIENLVEITLLAQKAGVPRHAFLEFMNNSVMGSIFTQYKTPALVNLDWAMTFTPALLLKDLDLGLDASHEYGVPMPVTAAAREVVQMHMGLAELREEPEKYLALDFSALLETMGLVAGMTMKSENVAVPSGLEI